MSFSYRPEIDGLRALAVMPVLFFHAGITPFSGGYLGVDVFFVISGYLITAILLREIDDGTFSLARFYERRARRILPALFLVILVSVPLALTVMVPSQTQDLANSILATLFFVSNFYFWRQDGDYFAAPVEEFPLIHTWSLAVEEQFYLLFPLLLLLILPRAGRFLLPLLVAVTIASLALGVWAHMSERYVDAVFYLLPSRAWELGIGAICGCLLKGRAPYRQDWLAGLGVGLIAFAILQFDGKTPTPSLPTLVPTLGAALVILFCTGSGFVARLLGSRGMVGIGLISYSLYLWHQPLLAFARIGVYSDPETWHYWALIVLSLGLAYLTWRFIETPMRRARVWPKRAFIRAAAGAFTVLFFFSVMETRLQTFKHIAFADKRYDLIEMPKPDPTKIHCMSHYGNMIPVDAVCTYGIGKTGVAILGNSHAEGFAVTLDAHLSDTEFTIKDFSASACGVEYLIPKPDLIRQRCGPWIEEAFREIANDRSISYVVISFRLDTRPKRELAALMSLVENFIEIDKKVLIVNQAPIQEYSIEQYLYFKTNDALNAPGRLVDEWAAIYRSARSMINSLPDNTIVVEVDDIFCDEKVCYPIRNGLALYFDDNHMSLQAAEMVTKRIADIILRESGE